MINNVERRESGHLFEELLWFCGTEGHLVRGILVADSLEEARVLVAEEGRVAMTGKLQYSRGKGERGQPMRVLRFVPNEGTRDLIVKTEVLSAPGESKV